MMSRAVQFGAVYVIAGVVISIAVAWGCGLWYKEFHWNEQTWGRVDGRYGGWIATTRGMTLVHVVPSEQIRRQDDLGTEKNSVVTRVQSGGKGVGQAVRHVERTTPEGANPDSVFAYGWPLRCMWARFIYQGPQGSVVTDCEWAIVVDKRNYPYQVVLAVRPLWLGLLVNALLYSAVIALLHGGYLLWRRKRRQRRGLCTACGYDLSGTAHANCPECGATPSPPVP